MCHRKSISIVAGHQSVDLLSIYGTSIERYSNGLVLCCPQSGALLHSTWAFRKCDNRLTMKGQNYHSRITIHLITVPVSIPFRPSCPRHRIRLRWLPQGNTSFNWGAPQSRTHTYFWLNIRAQKHTQWPSWLAKVSPGSALEIDRLRQRWCDSKVINYISIDDRFLSGYYQALTLTLRLSQSVPIAQSNLHWIHQIAGVTPLTVTRSVYPAPVVVIVVVVVVRPHRDGQKMMDAFYI